MKKLLFTIMIGISLFASGQRNCITEFEAYKSGLNVHFMNISKNSTGLGYYVWSFGDSTPPYYQLPHEDPTHVYTNPGTYKVCLVDSFCTDSTRKVCKNITVTSTPKISADFTHTQIGDGLYVFAGVASETAKAKILKWSYDDFEASANPIDTHRFKFSGQYHVCLTLVDSDNNYDYQCKTIDVTVINYCKADFNYYVENNQIVFGNQTLTSDTVPTFLWRFGDGSTSTLPSPRHQYTATGSYRVTLLLTGNCKDSIEYPVMNPDTITCNAKFTYTATNQRVLFNIQDKSEITLPSYYSFDFGDGAIGSSNGEAIEHIYDEKGSYWVCLTNYNPMCGGSPVLRCDSVKITNLVPICKADFYAFSSGYDASLSTMVKVYGTSAPYSVSIDWGNGQKSPLGVDSFYYKHLYDSAGIMPITLTLVSSAGCRDSITKVIGVGPTYKLSGQIKANGIWASYAGVNIYAYEPSTGLLTYYAYTGTNDSGRYEVELQQGYYLVQADFLFNSTFGYFLPTYYKNKLNWDVADVITLTGNRTGVDIDLIPFGMPGAGGAKIGGNVVFGYGNSDQNGPIPQGSPVNKMLIYLLDKDGKPVLFTHTETNGSFSFDNLPLGTYTVWAEMAGRQTEPTTVKVIAGNETVSDIKIVIGKNKITTSVKNPAVKMANSMLIYPNPFNDNLYLETNNQPIKAISMQNVLGEEISLAESSTTGSGVMIHTEELKPGLYIIRIETNSGEVSIQKVWKKD